MASRIPENSLSSFLTKRKIANIDIHAATGIPTVEISKLRNGLIKKISAKKLVLIMLSIGENIADVIEEIYPNLSLMNITPGIKISNQTMLGKFFDSVEDNTIKIISYKTGITIGRLKSLKTKSNAIPLAHELFLIELATEQKIGSLFNLLFKNLSLNTPQEQLRLREIEKIKSAKKR